MTFSRSYAPLTAMTLLTLASILPGQCALEPTVIAERYYSSGRSERHQKTSPTLPYGAPIPDSYGPSTTTGGTTNTTTAPTTVPSATTDSTTGAPAASPPVDTRTTTDTSGGAGGAAGTSSSTTETNSTGSTSAGAGIITPSSTTTKEDAKTKDAKAPGAKGTDGVGKDSKAQPKSQSPRRGFRPGRGGGYGTSSILPEEIGRVEAPRDMHIFQVEPTLIHERFYTSGQSERSQRLSTALPLGAPIPDRYTDAELQKEGVKPMSVETINTTPAVKPTDVPNK